MVDTVTLSANNQTLTGAAGNPSCNPGGFTGSKFRGLNFSAAVTGTGDFSELFGVRSELAFAIYTGTVTEATYLRFVRGIVILGTPVVTTMRGIHIPDITHSALGITTAEMIKIEDVDNGTNRFGLVIDDISGGTQARMLELGPTPYLRLLGSGEWTPAANETPLYLAEGTTPTLRQVKWKAGNALGVSDKVLVLV